VILHPKWQAALRWYLQWSPGDLSGVRSSQAGTVAQLELRSQLTHHRRTEHLSGPLECHPTPSWTDHDQAHDEMLKRVEDVGKERQVRHAWQACTLVEQERLFLAYVAEHAMRPELIAPLLAARRRFGPWRLLADRTGAAEMAAQREQARQHRPVQTSALLDRLSLVQEPTPEQWHSIHAIALECEQLASSAGEAFHRELMLAPAPRRAA
jgi:hypothetical protein